MQLHHTETRHWLAIGAQVKMEEDGDMIGRFFEKYRADHPDKRLSTDEIKTPLDAIEPMPYENINEVKENILECIDNTPLVKCSRLAAKYKLECNLLAKCEFLNLGGAVKDRIARRMICDAEEKGSIYCADKKEEVEFKRGDILIEPTSGNTGIGLAMANAVSGYNAIIAMPEKESQANILLELLNVLIRASQ